jgi:hypothetical protein
VLVVELTVDEGGHQVLVEGLVRGLLNVDVVLYQGLLQISLVSVARRRTITVVVTVVVA